MPQIKWNQIRYKYKDERFMQVHRVLVGYGIYTTYAYTSAGGDLLKLVINDKINEQCLKKLIDNYTLENISASNMGLELVFRIIH